MHDDSPSTSAASVLDKPEERPRRSALYVPGSNARAIEKACDLDADILLFDLEDAVAPSQKEAARASVCAALKTGRYEKKECIVRVNNSESPWLEEDLRAIAQVAPDGVLFPKTQSAQCIQQIEETLDSFGASKETHLWAMIETPLAVIQCAQIAQSTPRLAGLVIGANDLLVAMRGQHTPNRDSIRASLEMCVLAARAYNIAVLDTVYNFFKDEDGLRSSCIQGKTMGFDGKTLIHPTQIAPANEIFSPSASEIATARIYITAYKQALREGKGVAVVNNRIIEILDIEKARHILAQAKAIGL